MGILLYRSPGQKATSSIPSAGRSKSTATPTAAESKRPTTAPGGSRGARALPTSIATPTSHGGRERSANATAKGGVAKKPSTSPAKGTCVYGIWLLVMYFCRFDLRLRNYWILVKFVWIV